MPTFSRSHPSQVKSSSDMWKAQFIRPSTASDEIIRVGVLTRLRVSLPLTKPLASVVGRYGASQAMSLLILSAMRIRTRIATSAGLYPSAREALRCSCKTEVASARRDSLSCSGAAIVYNRVHAFTMNMTTDNAKALTTSKTTGASRITIRSEMSMQDAINREI